MEKTNGTKKGFGIFEAVFDIGYLCFAIGTGIFTLCRAFGTGRPELFLAGFMALVLGGGDSFHLVPRIAVILSGNEPKYHDALGIGQLVTSITMTFFYILLMQLGLLLFPVQHATALMAVLWILAVIRIVLCLLPQNDWRGKNSRGGVTAGDSSGNGVSGLSWWFGIFRNIPFSAMGIEVCVFFAMKAGLPGAAAAAGVPGLQWMWLAIIISFGCYLTVVLGARKHPMLGMLMMPKTLAYVWMLFMCAGI